MIRSGPLRPLPLIALALGWLLVGCGDDSSTAPRCGDGTLDPGEQCDDGTADDNPANGPCSALCTWRQFELQHDATNASRPDVAMRPQGDYVLVWQAEGAEGLDAWLAAWDPAGNPLIPATRVSDTTAGDQQQPRVAMADDGRFAVVWIAADDSAMLRPFAADGTPGDEVLLSNWTDGPQSEPDVAVNATGELVACWTSDGQDGDLTGVFAHRGDVDGQLAANEPFQVNTEWENSQENPRLDVGADGRFVVAWKGKSTEPG